MPSPTSAPATFIFAGGGTGGHLYPAVAIAESLFALAASSLPAAAQPEFLFLCSDRPIDRSILSAVTLAGVPARFQPLRAKPLGVRPLAIARFLWSWGPSVRATRRIISDLRAAGRNPIMVAMGGFVAAPAAQAARCEHVPIALVNLDAHPGKANRWIARHVRLTLSSAPIPPNFAATWQPIPPIVRRAARFPGSTADARRQLGLDPDRPVLMVTGGSQGARTISQLLLSTLQLHPAALREPGWQILHQTGPEPTPNPTSSTTTAAPATAPGPSPASAPMLDRLRDAYSRAGIPAVVEPFVHSIGLWWRAADLAVCRAGAGTVAEAWANAVPALFLPYPWHKDQHQRANARALVDARAALLADDLIDPDANARTIAPTLAELLTSPPRRAAMSAALTALGPADGADQAARRLLSLLPG